VGIDELARRHGVGRVGGHGYERAAEFSAYLVERRTVAGDSDDPRAGLAEGSDNAAAEARLAPVTSAVARAISVVGMRSS
jgi:hypothetical protein